MKAAVFRASAYNEREEESTFSEAMLCTLLFLLKCGGATPRVFPLGLVFLHFTLCSSGFS